jgi:hypothetical protein
MVIISAFPLPVAPESWRSERLDPTINPTADEAKDVAAW